MKAPEASQGFSHYKIEGIFPDAQGQLTHKSLRGSCRIQNLSKLLWLSLLHERMKEIKSKCRRLSGHNIIHQYKGKDKDKEALFNVAYNVSCNRQH